MHVQNTVLIIHMNDEFVRNLITFQTTLHVDVWDDPADESGMDIHLIDNFTIAIPGTVSNCIDWSNSLTVQGQLGIGKLTLAYFNLTTDPITSCSSADVPTSKIHVKLNTAFNCCALHSHHQLKQSSVVQYYTTTLTI